MNNKNVPRGQKTIFLSYFVCVNKDDIKDNVKDGFDIYEALKLNLVKNVKTEINRLPPAQLHTQRKQINKLEYDENLYLHLFKKNYHK